MDLNYQALRGMFIPYRLHMVLSGQLSDYLAGGNPEAQETYFHETVHWWQTSMTTYGWELWSGYRFIENFVLSKWKEETDVSPNARPFPLSDHVCMANPKLGAIRQTGRFLLHIIQTRFNHPDTMKMVSDISRDSPLTIGKNWDISPKIDLPNLKGYTLHGMDIIESHADFLSIQYSLNKIDKKDREMPPLKYWISIAWFHSQTEGDLYIFLPMIFDLSLMVTWKPLPDTEQEWRASCPAWRFVLLTKALQRIKHTLPDLNVSNYATIADMLLNQCGFKSMIDVIEPIKNRMLEKQELLSFESIMLDNLFFREKYPWCLSYPWLDEDVFDQLVDHRQAPIFQIGGEIKCGFSPRKIFNGKTLIPEKIVDETGFEIIYQGFFLTLLNEPPKSRVIANNIPCGYRYFDVPNTCIHQVEDNCLGTFPYNEECPFPIKNYPDDSGHGCQLEKFLRIMGINIKDLAFSTEAL